MGRPTELRYGAAAAVGVAAMFLVSGCAVFAQEPELERVLIAADLELTGDGSDLGTVYHQALQLRVEQVNQQGLLGNRHLELLVLDNRSDSATAAANLSDVTANPDVSAIITGGCDECTVTAVDTINEAGIPTIALASASEITVPVEERSHIFQLGPAPADTARALADEVDRVGAETIGLVTTNDLYGEEGLRSMTEAADRVGIDVVVSETVTADGERLDAVAAQVASYQPELDLVQDPNVQLSQETKLGPDAVVMWAPEPIVGQFALALRSQEYEGPFFLDPSGADEIFHTGPGGAALDGARMVFTETLVIDDVIATSPAKAARQTWFNDYTARHGTYHAYSSFAADAVEIIVEAINRFDSADRESVRAAVEGIQIDGFSGPIRIRLENHSALSGQALTILVAQGDRWRLATS